MALSIIYNIKIYYKRRNMSRNAEMKRLLCKESIIMTEFTTMSYNTFKDISN